MFDPSAPLRRHRFQSTKRGRVIRGLHHPDEAVITCRLSLLSSLCLQNADEPDRRGTTRESGLIQENQYIQRIPIFPVGGGNKAKVEREGGAERVGLCSVALLPLPHRICTYSATLSVYRPPRSTSSTLDSSRLVDEGRAACSSPVCCHCCTRVHRRRMERNVHAPEPPKR